VIHGGDETGISNQDQIGRSYALRGRTPVVARLAKRISQSMISAVSNRGLMRFMLYEGALDVERFLAFLRRLVKDALGEPVSLIETDPAEPGEDLRLTLDSAIQERVEAVLAEAGRTRGAGESRDTTCRPFRSR
jgi:hypothetical protein